MIKMKYVWQLKYYTGKKRMRVTDYIVSKEFNTLEEAMKFKEEDKKLRLNQKDEEINNLQDQVNKNNESSRNFQNDIVKVENFEIIRNVIKVQDVGTNCNLKNCGNKSAEGFDMCFLM